MVLYRFDRALHGFIITKEGVGRGAGGDGAVLPVSSLMETVGFPGPAVLASALWPASKQPAQGGQTTLGGHKGTKWVAVVMQSREELQG